MPLGTATRAAVIERALSRSPWLQGLARRHPDWFTPEAFERVTVHWPEPPPLGDEPAVMAFLRREVTRERARIAARDLAGVAPLEETLSGLSELAERACQLALETAEVQLEPLHGRPYEADGTPIRPVVLGMGKLGGQELNFSSDVDLIFCFTANGETDGPRPLDASGYYARVVQRFTRYLAERTAEGFAYRVDWLLRPFGSAGAPAASFASMEDYYQVHGREWERYALIKARPVAGDREAGARLLAALTPFIYRRYLDFTAIANLRELKRLIEDEVARKGLEDNVKLGAGGIREVEFIVQSFQLVRGGRDVRLRSPRLRPTLARLAEAGMMAAEDARRLDADYVFLRRLENAIQMQGDEQTHAFPRDRDSQERIAQALGLADAAALVAETQAVRARVRAQFAEVFAEKGGAEAATLGPLVALAFEGRMERPALTEALEAAGLAPGEAVAGELLAIAQDRHLRLLSEASVLRLRELTAQLLEGCGRHADPGTVARRALSVLARITGRTPYVSLLRESPVAREQLLRLVAASPWLTEYLGQTPALLDHLLDPRTLYAPPDAETIAAELNERLARMPPEDPEAFMNTLRHFQKEITLRVAAADLVEALPLVKVSDRLTWLAEALIRVAVAHTLEQMTAEYGQIRRKDGAPATLGVIAYGKLGGIEMGYGSDLDLVFVHDADAPDAMSEGGPRRLDATSWFARAVQRLMNLLTARTAAGRVYEVDLQLRPHGNAGPPVGSFASFADYQRREAWLWEHQALTRARLVCGPEPLASAFEALRREVLARPREPRALAVEIAAMREKMRINLDRSNAERWDLKQGRGGLADAEFITQYWVLREAHRAPDVTRFSDNWRQLEALAALGVLSPQDRDALITAYRELREAAHRLALQQQEARVPVTELQAARACISGYWQRWLSVPDEASR